MLTQVRIYERSKIKIPKTVVLGIEWDEIVSYRSGLKNPDGLLENSVFELRFQPVRLSHIYFASQESFKMPFEIEELEESRWTGEFD